MERMPLFDDDDCVYYVRRFRLGRLGTLRLRAYKFWERAHFNALQRRFDERSHLAHWLINSLPVTAYPSIRLGVDCEATVDHQSNGEKTQL